MLDVGEREWSRNVETVVNELVGANMVQENRLGDVERDMEKGAFSKGLQHRDVAGPTARSLGKARGNGRSREREDNEKTFADYIFARINHTQIRSVMIINSITIAAAVLG